MSKVPQFKRHERDTGSSEYQVSVLSARIAQLSTHMISNRKDYSSRRGLEALLGRRRHFMQYLYRTDRSADAPEEFLGFRNELRSWLCLQARGNRGNCTCKLCIATTDQTTVDGDI